MLNQTTNFYLLKNNINIPLIKKNLRLRQNSKVSLFGPSASIIALCLNNPYLQALWYA